MAVRKVIKGEAPVDAASTSSAALSDRKVIDREVFSAQQRAEQIKQEAEAQAAARRAEGQAQARQVHVEAVARGSADGTAEAAAKVIAGYHQRGETLRAAVDDCLLLARRICAKVMGSELRLDDAEVRRIARLELDRTTARRRVSLCFSADRLAALERRSPVLWQRATALPELVLSADSGVPDEAVTVQSDVGEITIAGERAEAVLREVLGVPAEEEPPPPE
jgi:flagellar biosynthesis/type III secretory pathway protein FliH